jgi:hypothetical protein
VGEVIFRRAISIYEDITDENWLALSFSRLRQRSEGQLRSKSDKLGVMQDVVEKITYG